MLTRVLASLCLLVVLACEDDAETSSDRSSQSAPDTNQSENNTDKKYVVASVVFGADSDNQTSYLSVLDSLDKQEIDYDRALERPGWADLWTHEGFVFVSSREDKDVTKYSVDEDGSLVEEGRLSFSNFDIDVAFWSNTFVAPDKAYMLEETSNYVVWNPMTMEITGMFELPQLPERSPLIVRAGTLDRANVIRDGKLYTPMYWSDEDYAMFAPDARVVVTDIARDEVVDTIDVPCVGLDIGSIDDAGNMYFSTWTSGIYEPLVLDKPANCVAKIAAGEDTAIKAFTFAKVAEGREGAAVRSFHGSNGKLLMSIFHNERVDLKDPDSDPFQLISEQNWRTWIFDPKDEKAEVVESLDWNSGATYVTPIDDLHYVLVPGSDYESTTVVALDDELQASERFELRGWGTRIFRLR